MKYTCLSVGLALATFATTATAGNLDRNKTPIDIIFESGNRAELSFGYVSPSVSGTDTLGNATGNVGNAFGLASGALKLQFSKGFSLAAIYDQPYGTDIEYSGDPASTQLGGTAATAETDALTVMLRYDVSDRIMVYGGPRVVSAKGNISPSGLALGPLDGYNLRLSPNQGIGYVVGAAYAIPETAFRVALTYHSAVNLELPSTETFPGGAPVAIGPTKLTLPQSAKLQIQSLIAGNNLAFGSIRWSDWRTFEIDPPSATPNLAETSDAWTYEIGIARQFTEKFSASLAFSYERRVDNTPISPLAPTGGYQSLSLGGKYQITDAVTFSTGIQYYWLGDALVRTGPSNTVQASFRNNEAIGVGAKIGVSF